MNAFFSGNGYGMIDQSTMADSEMAFTNTWGMADDDLYRQAIKAADSAYRSEQPFFFHLVTTTNHRPYTYPDGRIDIPSGSAGKVALPVHKYHIPMLVYSPVISSRVGSIPYRVRLMWHRPCCQ